MVDELRAASGASGALGGAAAGAQIGSVVPGIGTTLGAVLGGIVGGISGLVGGGSGREQFRAQRRSEFFRNAALRLQATQQTRAGGRVVSAQRTAAAGANVTGATITRAALQALIDVNRARTATLAGISTEFQSGGGRATVRDELPSERTRAMEALRRRPMRQAAKPNPLVAFAGMLPRPNGAT